MDNLIEVENNLSNNYELEPDSDNQRLVALTRKNVAKVEAMIRNDSAYLRATNKGGRPTFFQRGPRIGQVKYGGSSAFWMTRLKDALDPKMGISGTDYEEIIKGAVAAVDRENSTHLNADRQGREVVTRRILDIPREELKESLRNPDYDNMKLFTAILERTAEVGEHGRCNPSFASKFCHYACFYVFEGTEWQDNYSIFDNVLKKVLPLYLAKFKLKNGTRNYTQKDLKNYATYRDAIEALRGKSAEKISRNGLDHLLWYFHKGRLDGDLPED